ncbi:hypothetical protein IQ251_16935 [Saccharopolyspora sp. HNM0983]|uniref:DNA-binding beta-propeller fold protein YncE n=1 Tax=Saccharopolyspora montiporae TaxID=2781240 RepID=A0A929BDP1_9PSEU|nr:hypothetical protein [Saccharopolyspora sp. HNM0983]MBE9376138.1 hypothetical protein [Saccharopolyspora sp. HNM0983]
MRRLVITCLAATLLTGCGMDDSGDPLQVTDQLTAAQPAPAPRDTPPAAGTVHPAPAIQHTAYDATTGTLLTTSATTLAVRTPGAEQQRTIDLPAAPASLRTEHGHALLALPDADAVIRVDLRTGATTDTPVPGRPVDALDLGPDRIATAQQDTREVTVREHGRPSATAAEFDEPAHLLTTGGDLNVLDELTTSLTPVDPATGEKGAGLRAGAGATNAVTDRYGRILAIDTRGGELLAFSTDPLIMKQRYPVPGSPYGLAYDPTRDMAWTTLTETNELVGYDVTGGQPEERHRIPTVSQPDSVTADPETGKIYVASANGAGIQVVTP